MIDYSKLAFPKPTPKVKKVKWIKKISDKRKKRLSWYSEVDLFRKILIDRQDNWYLTCCVCWKRFLIENAWPTSFSHLLSKWQNPAFRLLENNIKIVCNDISMNSCHTKLDSIVNKIKKDIWNSELEKLIASWKDIKDLIDKYK